MDYSNGNNSPALCAGLHRQFERIAMRLLIIPALASLLAGCVATAPVAPPAAKIATCTPESVIEAGRGGTLLPTSCKATDPQVRERYAIGRQVAKVEEELREVNYLIASRDGPRLLGGAARVGYRGFGSQAYLISRRIELKNVRRALRRQAGIL